MKKYIITAIAALVLFAACKDDEIPIDNNTYHPGTGFTFATSMAQAESMSHDILITALRFATDTTLWHRSGYPIVTATSATAYPRTVTVDFGNDDTTTLINETGDIRTRSGIIQIQLNANWHASGATVTINTTNLKLSDMMTISGRMELANRGLHEYFTQQCYTFEYVINDAIVTTKRNDIFKYSSNKIYRLTVGESTPTLNDDVFHITGTASITKDTATATLSIESEYYAPYSCFWYRDGKAKITEGTIERQISFSQKVCSPMAEIIFKPHPQQSPDSVVTYADLP
ncbi:MAG: hypothetical protein J6T33_02340 [Bacteroidales bacterium]|nr:hypothetical protein [Bacteroidales bacterium]